MKLMSEEQINNWEEEQNKGRLSYILQSALIFTPLFLFFRPIIYYFVGEKPFGIEMIFEWFIQSFFTSLGICAVDWFYKERLYRKSVSQKLEKNTQSDIYGKKEK